MPFELKSSYQLIPLEMTPYAHDYQSLNLNNKIIVSHHNTIILLFNYPASAIFIATGTVYGGFPSK